MASILNYKIKLVKHLFVLSLRSSNRERGETDLKLRLESIVPDISRQYSTFIINEEDRFLVEKVRTQHAFQMSLIIRAVRMLLGNAERRPIHVLDIGDSSGTHMLYLKALARDLGIDVRTVSVNLDPVAVKKIEERGLPVVMCRAEDIQQQGGILAELFVSLEMLEHLFDPISFLHSLSVATKCRFFAITVPYLRKSRVGLHHLRSGRTENVYAENTHIFELCPEDWDLLFEFSGWKVVFRDRYTQYPRGGLLRLTQFLWEKTDFNGFYGVILERDPERARQYSNWPE